MPLRRTVVMLWCLAWAVWGTGCGSAPQPAAFAVGPGEYPAAFAAAKQELRALGFELARVDAREGIIETRPQRSSGLATPWSQQESSFWHEVENLANHQRRRVRVGFVPSAGPGADGAEPPDADTDAADRIVAEGVDLRRLEGPLEGRVTVQIERLHRLGVRPSTASVRLSSVAEEPAREASRAPARFVVSLDEDPLFAGRITARIRRAMDAQADR